MKLNICMLGLVPYKQALDLQYQLLSKRQKGEIEDTLLLLEHPPVITLGIRGKYSNIYLPLELLREKGVDVIEVRRGGDVTYHGPGQIVGYPIMDLSMMGKRIHPFIQGLELTIISLLKNEFGIDAENRTDKFTGVWVGDKKITAIGVAVDKWVTMHGFAFNVNTDLSHFDWINPCGLSMGVTSVEALTGEKADMKRIYSLTADYFAGAFARQGIETDVNSLLNPTR